MKNKKIVYLLALAIVFGWVANGWAAPPIPPLRHPR